MKLNIAAASLFAFGALLVTGPAVSWAAGDTTVAAVDTDHDGTIDLAEAKKAAMTNFSAMDKDHEGTLDSKEAGMDVSAADPDKDGTLDKGEFGAAVTSAFKAADPDGDGTVDAKELASPAGQKLEAMIKQG